MAAPLTAAITGWCSRRMVRDHVVEHLHRPQRDGRQRQPVDVRDGAGVLVVGPRAEAPAGARDDHDPHPVVAPDLAQGVAEGDHDVEGHGVHPLGPVERDDGHLGVGSADFGEGHGGIVDGRLADPPPVGPRRRRAGVAGRRAEAGLPVRAIQRSRAARASQE